MLGQQEIGDGSRGVTNIVRRLSLTTSQTVSETEPDPINKVKH